MRRRRGLSHCSGAPGAVVRMPPEERNGPPVGGPNHQGDHQGGGIKNQDIGNYGMAIFPQHAEMLAAAGISVEHARARGYKSVDTKVRVHALGITRAGCNVPGLLAMPLSYAAGLLRTY